MHPSDESVSCPKHCSPCAWTLLPLEMQAFADPLTCSPRLRARCASLLCRLLLADTKTELFSTDISPLQVRDYPLSLCRQPHAVYTPPRPTPRLLSGCKVDGHVSARASKGRRWASMWGWRWGMFTGLDGGGAVPCLHWTAMALHAVLWRSQPTRHMPLEAGPRWHCRRCSGGLGPCDICPLGRRHAP